MLRFEIHIYVDSAAPPFTTVTKYPVCGAKVRVKRQVMNVVFVVAVSAVWGLGRIWPDYFGPGSLGSVLMYELAAFAQIKLIEYEPVPKSHPLAT